MIDSLDQRFSKGAVAHTDGRWRDLTGRSWSKANLGVEIIIIILFNNIYLLIKLWAIQSPIFLISSNKVNLKIYPCFPIYTSPKMGATKTLFEKVGYNTNKLENYGLHYWFQGHESMCLFFSKRRRWVIWWAVSNFFPKMWQ